MPHSRSAPENPIDRSESTRHRYPRRMHFAGHLRSFSCRWTCCAAPFLPPTNLDGISGCGPAFGLATKVKYRKHCLDQRPGPVEAGSGAFAHHFGWRRE